MILAQLEARGHLLKVCDIVHYRNIIPNCQHRLLPYIPELDEDNEKTKRVSNREFKDNRTEFSKERYKERQKVNRRERQIEKLSKQNEVLRNTDTPEAKEILKSNREKIKKYSNEVEDIKKWEIDSLKDNELFTDILTSKT